MTDRQLSLALDLAALGWRVFPCKPDKTPRVRWKEAATSDPQTLRDWFAKWPDGLIGIYCEGSGIFAVDVDCKNGIDGWQTFEGLIEVHGEGVPVAVGPIQQTPSGGYHLLFELPEGRAVPNTVGALGPGLDLRSNGYICTGPGYTWLDDHSPTEALTKAPDWLLDLIEKPRTTAPAPSYQPPPPPQDSGTYWLEHYLDQAFPGNRNEQGFSLACQLRDSGLNRTLAESIMLEYAHRVPGDGYLESEALESLRSAYGAPAREPATLPGTGPGPVVFPISQSTNGHQPDSNGTSPPQPGNLAYLNLTDGGNAEAIAYLYSDRLRYDHPSKRWLIWDRHRWQPDPDGEVERLALQSARERLAAAAGIDDQKQRARVAKWALGSENRSRIMAAINGARTLPPIATAGGWDENPWLLGCKNGIIDLQTGELRPGQQADQVTLTTGQAYDPEATAPRWERFLSEIFGDDRPLIEYVQRAAGYCLTGDVREQVLFLCWGSGANGKSTFLSALRAALGDYSANTPFSTFELNAYNHSTNDLAALAGRRCVTAAETNESRRLNEGRVKAITGGDPVTARFLFGEFFTYDPSYKIWLAMNHKPLITGTDEGIWRRIHLIPFTVSFKGRPEKDLASVLQGEAAGILAWAVRGVKAWLDHGLKPPSAVLDATQDYRMDSDLIGAFLDDRTTLHPDLSTKAGDLYKAYVSWCDDAGEKASTGTAFGLRVREKTGISSEKVGGYKYYLGLGLNDVLTA